MSFSAYKKLFCDIDEIYTTGAIKREVYIPCNAHSSKGKALKKLIIRQTVYLKKEYIFRTIPSCFENVILKPSKKEKEIQSQIENNFYFYDSNGQSQIAVNGLTKLLRHRQFSDGVYFPDDSSKLDFYETIIDDLIGSKTIIFCIWPKIIEQIKSELLELSENELKVYTYHGSMAEKDKKESYDNFRKDGNIFIGSESICESLNLQFCHNMVLHSLPLSYDKFYQLHGRIDRKGQSNSCNFKYLFNNDIDYTLFDMLKNKKDISKYFS